MVPSDPAASRLHQSAHCSENALRPLAVECGLCVLWLRFARQVGAPLCAALSN